MGRGCQVYEMASPQNPQLLGNMSNLLALASISPSIILALPMAILMLHVEGVIRPVGHTNMVYADAIHGSFEENLESYMFLWRTLYN